MRKVLPTLAVVVVVLGILLVVADRVGAHYAEREIAQRVQTRLAARGITSEPADVTIEGIPFLTQVARGRYDDIELVMRDLRGGTIPLPLLTVHALDVDAPTADLMDGTGKVVAGKVTGDAKISYADLIAASGLTGVSLSGDGKVLHVSGKVPLVGEVRGALSAKIVGDRISLQVTELIAVNGGVAQTMLDSVRSRLAVTLKLPVFPFQMKLLSVTPEVTGLQIAVAADNVELS